ncbi:hypothetical protein Hanom_Chr04g00326941 [Helianthus anomalus]
MLTESRPDSNPSTRSSSGSMIHNLTRFQTRLNARPGCQHTPPNSPLSDLFQNNHP